MQPHLLADENVPRPIVARLVADGWSVVEITILAPGDKDDQVLARAHDAGLILLTQDRDFGELAIARGLPIGGVVLFELERLSLQLQAERLADCLLAETDNLVGYFLVVEPGRVRRRALPVQ